VVQSNLVGYEPEKWRQCLGITEGVRAGATRQRGPGYTSFGMWGPIKELLAMNIWTITWMSLRFGSIAAILGTEVSFFIDYYSRR